MLCGKAFVRCVCRGRPRSCRSSRPVHKQDGIAASLRNIADEVDAELAALRAAAQEQTQRREEAEALLDAARCELRRLETVVTRRTKDGAREHGAEYARENAAAKMMAELSRAQTRASAAESRGEAAAKELANLRRQLENKQTDGVLATALSSLMALTILTYLVHSPTGLKLLEGISHS
jgi:chromosome segregation ATPase